MSRPDWNPRSVQRGNACYPESLLQYLGDQLPQRVAMIGNPSILRQPLLALFCSVRCPASLILQAHDLAQHLRQETVGVIGGFHSPVEQECLAVLLRGNGLLVICPARSLEGMRLPVEYREPLEDGRLLLLSPFEKERRATRETALYRNRFVAALAEKVVVVYAESAGTTERLYREVLAWQKPLCTLENEHNAHLIALGAVPLRSGIRQNGTEGYDDLLGNPFQPESSIL